jgi:signal peptidase II
VILPWYGHWPAFNVADSCICIAAGLFLISGFTPQKKAP